MKIKPIITILCDDVRMETNNKPFLIGIYLNDIIIESIPEDVARKPLLMFNLAMWMPFEPSSVGEVQINIRLVGDCLAEERLIKGKVNFPKAPPAHEISALSIPRITLAIKQEGDLKVQFKHAEEKKWQTLRSIPIRIKPKI